MLKELRIQNFKIWEDTGPIRMAPITLFFGTNSSGKSSIGQFLMMLRQTVDSPDRKAVFFTGSQNSPVQLGSYQEMVYRRDSGRDILFQYRWELPDSMKITDPISKKMYTGNEMAFSAVAGMSNNGKNQRTIMKSMEYVLNENDSKVFSIQMKLRGSAKIEYEVEAENYLLSRNKGRPWYWKDTVRFYGFPDEVVAYYQNAQFVQELNLRHETLFRTMFYLGPLRTKAERLYTWTGIEPEHVGFSGENTVAAILASQNRKINLGWKKPTKPFERLIAEKLKQMGLINEFEVNPISTQRQEYEVKLRINRLDNEVDLPDVGFGISQVLPVLVQCFYAPRNSIILLEQPEIHLHPSAQSALADVMIDVINAKEDYTNRNIQLIIETHSEHFLRRLQRRIAENAIEQEKVAAYFANYKRDKAVLEPLDIDLFGNIRNWPEHFFGDEMGDVTAQAKAAMERRIDQVEKQEK